MKSPQTALKPATRAPALIAAARLTTASLTAAPHTLLMLASVLIVLLLMFPHSTAAQPKAFPEARTQETESYRTQLLRLAQATLNAEEKLSSLEADYTALSQKVQTQGRALKTQRHSQARLLAGLIQLHRTPDIAPLLRPETPIDAYRAQLLLRAALPAIAEKTHAHSLAHDRLLAAQKRLGTIKNEAQNTAHRLETQRTKLAAAMESKASERRAGSLMPGRDAEILRSLAREAMDLPSLLGQLEHTRTNLPEQDSPSGDLRAIVPAIGSFAGTYGEADENGEKQQGVTILTRPGALVVSPAAGQVRFAGEFRSYGKILILGTDCGYHILLSGLERLDAGAGDALSAGEPIGFMVSGNGSQPELYLEVWHSGATIDPHAALLPGKGLLHAGKDLEE